MLQHQSTSLLADYPLFEGSDVELSRRALSSIFNPVFLEPEKGDDSFSFAANGVQFPHLWISALSYAGNPLLGPEAPLDYHTLQLIPRGQIHFDIDGERQKATGEQALMLSSGQRIRLQPKGTSECLSLVIKDESLRDLLSVWLGHSRFSALTFVPRLNMSSPQVMSFLSYFTTVVTDLDRNSGLVKMPVAIASLENMLMTFMLCGLEHNLTGLISMSSPMAGDCQVREVEEYLTGNSDKPITMQHLTEVTGHSGRSLYRAFRRYRQYTPMQFLRKIRLQLAREKLLSADSSQTVTTIAYECGFTHLGRFAGEYHRCFGEKPSRTLFRSLQ